MTPNIGHGEACVGSPGSALTCCRGSGTTSLLTDTLLPDTLKEFETALKGRALDTGDQLGIEAAQKQAEAGKNDWGRVANGPVAAPGPVAADGVVALRGVALAVPKAPAEAKPEPAAQVEQLKGRENNEKIAFESAMRNLYQSVWLPARIEGNRARRLHPPLPVPPEEER